MNRNTRFNNVRRSRGFTLIEMLVVVAIIAVVAAFASGRIGNFGSANKVSNEIVQVSSLIANTKQLRSSTGYGTAATDLVPTLIKAGLVPAGMQVSGTTIKSPFGGTVTVVSTGNGYTVTDPTLPQDACIQVLPKISQSGIVSTKVGTSTAITGEVDSAAATTNCASATANSVAWTSAD